MRIDVSEWLDARPMGAFQIRVVLLGLLVTTFDGFDTQAIAFTGPALAQAFGIGAGGLVPVVVAGVMGMALGALLLGPVGDRFGRRQAILLSVGIFGLGSLASGFATHLPALIVLRFMTGIGMGGAVPNIYTLASEYAPGARRGIVMLLAGLGLPIGAIIGGLLATYIIPTWGWQGVFLLGGIAPLLALPLIAWMLPESPQVLAARGDHVGVGAVLARVDPRNPPPVGAYFTLPERPARSGVRTLFAPGLRRTTAALWLIYFFNWVGWFGLVLWLPAALHASGLPAARVGLATVVLNGAALLFLLPVAWYLPRLPLRAAILGLLAGGVVVMLALAVSGDRWTLTFVLVGLSGLMVGGPQIALNYLAVLVYPTAARATGVGWAIGLGRLGSVGGGMLGGLLLERWGATGFFIGLAVPLLAAMLATLLVRLDQTGAGVPAAAQGSQGTGGGALGH